MIRRRHRIPSWLVGTPYGIPAPCVLVLLAVSLVATAHLVAATLDGPESPVMTRSSPRDFGALVGMPADIAPSAYQYRANRPPADNPPESWLPLMWFAHQPLNKPVDIDAPAIKQVLCGLLWEEIRPVQRVELTWSGDLKRSPSPEDVEITVLQAKGTSSSWWNNLEALPKQVKSTPLHPHDLHDAVDECHHLQVVAKIRINAA